jgi:prevent-host-death family protein
MAKTISTSEARTDFERLVASVGDTKEPVMVEGEGRPPVIVISLAEYEQLLHDEATRDWATIDELRRHNAGKDPDEVFADVTAEMRRERRQARARSA